MGHRRRAGDSIECGEEGCTPCKFDTGSHLQGQARRTTADAGARVTLTEVNDININNQQWVFRQLGTIYHEFAHIVHQRYNLPPGWENISPQGYTGAGSWYNLTDEEALIVLTHDIERIERWMVGKTGYDRLQEIVCPLKSKCADGKDFNERVRSRVEVDYRQQASLVGRG